MSTKASMSRRAFLRRLAVLGAVSATAAACAPAPTPAAPKPAEPTKAAAAPAQPTAAPAAKVEIKGTLQVVQKQDFFPAMNEWLQTEVKAFCKEKGWPVEISYEAGYTNSAWGITPAAARAAEWAARGALPSG